VILSCLLVLFFTKNVLIHQVWIPFSISNVDGACSLLCAERHWRILPCFDGTTRLGALPFPIPQRGCRRQRTSPKVGLFSSIASYAFWPTDKQKSLSAGHNQCPPQTASLLLPGLNWGGFLPPELLIQHSQSQLVLHLKFIKHHITKALLRPMVTLLLFQTTIFYFIFFSYRKTRLMVLRHPPTKEARLKAVLHFSFRKLQQAHLEFEWRPEQCSPTNKQHHPSDPKSLPGKRDRISRGCVSQQPTVLSMRQHALTHPGLKSA